MDAAVLLLLLLSETQSDRGLRNSHGINPVVGLEHQKHDFSSASSPKGRRNGDTTSIYNASRLKGRKYSPVPALVI
ncbi:hypothetical protein TNCV_3548601 [Trichonephila clavipes]|nr:hypothetical protein TNCV_3548601 [Trichonephila clavipes]